MEALTASGWASDDRLDLAARLARHARYAVFQFAEAALPREVFAGVLDLINGLCGPPAETASA